MLLEMTDATHQQITQICEKGDELAQQGDCHTAVEHYLKALALVPKPITEWGASTWILTAIGDAYFSLKNYEKARQALLDAMHCPDAIGNPFIHLRLGEVQFEMGNHAKAQDELMRAYMGAGEEIFQEEDKKYFEFIKPAVTHIPLA